MMMMMMPFNVKLATLHTGKVEEKENKDYLNDLHAESKGTKNFIFFISSFESSCTTLHHYCNSKVLVLSHPANKKEIQLKNFPSVKRQFRV